MIDELTPKINSPSSRPWVYTSPPRLARRDSLCLEAPLELGGQGAHRLYCHQYTRSLWYGFSRKRPNFK